jgi:hypothetical protein
MELLIYLFLILREKTTCFYSSFVFLINVLFCFLKSEFIYGLLFLLLFATSVFFYTYDDLVPYLLDQIAIFFVVFYGFLLFLFKKKKWHYVILVLSTFLATLFLYYYGYKTQSYCYGYYEYEWHSILHIISSIGHLGILFM